jgi:branched-chain amino acid transport system ATP-binding protein
MLLAGEKLEIRYGPVPAVRDLSFHVDHGEIVCFVGPNGAGKSTTMMTIAGVMRPTSGEIRIDDRSIAGLAPEDVVAKGISLVPEGRHIFGRLTVRENLLVASGLRGGLGGVAATLNRLLTLFPVLKARYDSLAGNLSGGEQQQLAIARGLLTMPRLLIVDEPSLGLAPKFVELVMETLHNVRSEGTALLIVEQSMRRAISLADRIYLMRSGRIVADGPAKDFEARTDLEHVYFGGKARQ